MRVALWALLGVAAIAASGSGVHAEVTNLFARVFICVCTFHPPPRNISTHFDRISIKIRNFLIASLVLLLPVSPTPS